MSDKPHVDQIIEKAEAEVGGVTLTAHWNRMFSERALVDYDPDVMLKITSIEGAESLGWCYQCGKCTPVCPVDVVGSYSPRKIVHKVQRGMDLFADPDLWLCTTCMNCLRVCPKEVNMIDIMPAVREQAVLNGNMPPELAKAFENTFRYGNPLGEPTQKRADWTKEAGVPVPLIKELARPVDVLWYVECYPSYHPRGQDASRALARLFTTLGVDFATLGVEEKCTGDSQRLGGEKGLFEWLTEYNLKTLAKYQFNKIVVTDPHAFNAIKNQWPKYGGNFEVYHYTQFLASQLEKIPFKKKLDYQVTFHDPCYLGRHNNEFEAPRRLLEAVPGVRLIEMPRNRENGYCCGGGGGGMWLDSFSGDFITERLSERRVREAVETGAKVLAICCPYEPSRFEDAVKSTQNDGNLVVKDIVELIDESIRG